MTQRLDGKVCIITGGTSGIGEATVRRFAAAGATVVVAGRNAEKGEALAADLGDKGLFVATDVTREADIERLIKTTTERFGRLDCLFNNAGAGERSSPEEVTEEQLQQVMGLLVGSVLFGIKHAAPAMRASGGGSIINNSSIAAHRLGQGGYLYSIAKAAVSHATRIAGVSLGKDNIRVNAISPGAIATPIFWGGSARAQTLSDEENQQKLEKLERNLSRATPLPSSGLADDIASAALFLASDDGRFVNCHDLVVDGGRIAMFHEAPAG